MPSALLNWIVMAGPCSSTCFSAIQPPTRSATMGMIQTNGNERRLCSRPTACGISSFCGAGLPSLMASVERIPDEARVEAHGGEHREHDDGAERNRTGAGLDVCERTQVQQGHERAAYVDIRHRPTAGS